MAHKQTITEQKLALWIKLGLNVLFKGKAGVGKTSMIVEAWEKAGLKWMYFSGATLDPWVDFVGIPQKVTDANGNSFIELIRPKQLANDEVEAIFIDEYNRSHKKIRNAVMELIQFKSINGKKFKNLKMIWAAVNPADEEEMSYDVEQIDPAQLDRFQIQIEVPYEISRPYFATKFGADVASQAITWWNEQTAETKNLVSPRRLEYALNYFFNNGDLGDVLPAGANIPRFVTLMKNTPKMNKLKEMYNNKDTAAAKLFLADEDNYGQVISTILEKRPLYEFFIPLMPEEKISKIVAENEVILNWALQNHQSQPVVKSVLEDIVEANTNKDLVRKIGRAISVSNVDMIDDAIKNGRVNNNANCYSTGQKSNAGYAATLQIIKSGSNDNTHERKNNYNLILRAIPSTMSIQDALSTLDTLELLVSRSQLSIVDSNFERLVEVTNTAVGNLHTQGHKFKSFKDSYPKLSRYLATKDGFYFSGVIPSNVTTNLTNGTAIFPG